MSANSASIVVQFGANFSSSSHLSAEIDTRPGGLNAGKTTFQPGDTVAILVYKTSDVTLSQVSASSGSISPASSPKVTVNKTDTITFANSREASIDVPALGGSLDSVQWMGNDLGTITLNGTRAIAANSGIGVANVTYSAEADVYMLTSPASINGSTDYSIVVVIVGESS